MSEKNRKRIVYLALVAAIVWGAYNFLGRRHTIEIAAPETIQPATAQSSPTGSGEHPDILADTDRPWGSDPFRTRHTASGHSGPAWVLTGIVYNSTSPLAYINRKAVREGESIDNAKVMKIERKSVTLKYQGSEFTIRVSRG